MSNKPSFILPEVLPPVTMHKYERYLPTAFDDSLSMLEKVNKVIHYLYEYSDVTNEMVLRWNEVYDWVMNEGLEVAVLDKLNVWLKDGTLADIINKDIFEDLNGKIDGLTDDFVDFKTEVVEQISKEVEVLVEEFGEFKKDLTGQVDIMNTKFNQIYGLADSRVYLYVDAKNGNDAVADGTKEKPYKSIQKCLDDIPKVINQDRYIMIEPGEYLEDLRIKSIVGSAIYMQSTTGADYKVNSAVFFDLNGLVRVENCEFVGKDPSLPFNLRFSRCSYATVNNCRFVQNKLGTEVVAIEFDGTQGSVNSTHFDAQYTCVFSQNGSEVRVDSTNTHGPTPSLRAVSIFSGHINFNGTVEWIDKTLTPITASRGGRYTWDRTYIDLNLLNGWESINESTYKARAFKDDSNMIHLFGTIRGGTVGSVDAFQLPEWYRPVFNTMVFPAFVDDNTIAKIVIDRSGSVQVQRGSNTPYISLSGISFYSGR